MIILHVGIEFSSLLKFCQYPERKPFMVRFSPIHPDGYLFIGIVTAEEKGTSAVRFFIDVEALLGTVIFE
jgi:hypothetical protein